MRLPAIPTTRAPVDANDARPAAAAGRVAGRPLTDGCTERVRLIEFVWRAGSAQQSVILVARELLH